jgi:hypothetical protein
MCELKYAHKYAHIVIIACKNINGNELQICARRIPEISDNFPNLPNLPESSAIFDLSAHRSTAGGNPFENRTLSAALRSPCRVNRPTQPQPGACATGSFCRTQIVLQDDTMEIHNVNQETQMPGRLSY